MGSRRLNIIYDAEWRGKRETDALIQSNKKLDKSLDGVDKKFDKTAKSSEKTSNTLRNLVAGGAIIAVGSQFARMGAEMLTAASDVEEMQSKFNTVFRDLGGEVTAELEEFADAANRSIFDLQGFAATLQDTFVPLGFARDSAADMSVELVKLAEDLASFNNLNTDEVVRDLQSALVGNTETLRKYGVVASQAAIEQYALEQGLVSSKKEIDAQIKAQAILGLTLESTTDAQGDAIKTSDSYANQLKGLEAAQKELNVELGTIFLPIAADVVGALTDIASGAAAGAKAIRETTAAAEELADQNYENAVATGDYEEEARKMLQTLEDNTDFMFEFLGGAQFVRDEMFRLAAATADFSGSQEELKSSLEDVFNASVELGDGYVRIGGHLVGTEEDLVSLAKKLKEEESTVLAHAAAAADVTKGWADAASVMRGEAIPAINDTAGAIDDASEAIFPWNDALEHERKLASAAATHSGEMGDKIHQAGVQMETAKSRAERWNEELDKLEGRRVDVTVNTNYTTTGSPSEAAGWGPQDPDNPQTKRHGGSVSPGQSYLVGEAGPELFVPRDAGQIVPNNQMGGMSPVINITINGSGGGMTLARTIASKVSDELGKLN